MMNEDKDLFAKMLTSIKKSEETVREAQMQLNDDRRQMVKALVDRKMYDYLQIRVSRIRYSLSR